MEALRITGGAPLRGEVQASGSKNASLPIMAAALLAGGTSRLEGIPDLADVRALCQVLEHMGAKTTREGSTMILDATDIGRPDAKCETARTLRASILVLGPLLVRFGKARVSLPGGCAIGARPIDQHLKGLRCLGATIHIEDDCVVATAPNGLRGAEVRFDMPTVTGTENLLLAATMASGITVLSNAAQEPEVTDLAHALINMGAEIHGAGTSEIMIRGCDTLRPYVHKVMADRIESGTFLVAGAMAGAPLTVVGVIVEHQKALIDKLREAGAKIHIDGNRVTVNRARPRLGKAIDVQTAPYPGFSTDMQAAFMALLAVSEGSSTVVENMFENRFKHVAELGRLGADIQVDGKQALICGVPRLFGSTVTATDLRASASLVLAGLVAEGETVVRHVYHLDRGYECVEKKLRAVGAKIRRFTEMEVVRHAI